MHATVTSGFQTPPPIHPLFQVQTVLPPPATAPIGGQKQRRE